MQRIRIETGVRDLDELVEFFKNQKKDYSELLERVNKAETKLGLMKVMSEKFRLCLKNEESLERRKLNREMFLIQIEDLKKKKELMIDYNLNATTEKQKVQNWVGSILKKFNESYQEGDDDQQDLVF